MKLSRHDKPAAADTVTDDDADGLVSGKGRPTPKRRDSQGRRGPVSAPKTRKEASARQRQLAREQKTARTSAPPRSIAEQRAALKRGDPSALPRRDQGSTRKLARDYVDSKRMLSNYLLWLFPLMVVSAVLPGIGQVLELVVVVGLIVLIVEWYLVGKRIRALALERNGDAQGGNLAIGFYAGSRAYLPRRWRLPNPQVARGDPF